MALQKIKYIGFAFILAMYLWAIIGCGSVPEKEKNTTKAEQINIAEALSKLESDDCFETAQKTRQIELPKDAGPHNGFRTEWWYYTGNLFTAQGREFGYQLTFFRQALSCEPVQGRSKWRTRQLYFAHFAVTDTRAKHFYSDQRMNRESLGIAGAKSFPYQVWIDNWQVRQKGDQQILTAESKAFAVHLDLRPEKPVLLQGENGFSRKGKEPANASHYYSFPRLGTTGTITINDSQYRVKGVSWFDHEWNTSALGSDAAGWDWFSVHLEDGRDLMVCQVRNRNGSANGYGFGSISFSDGRVQTFKENQFDIIITGHWKSPDTGKTYPAKWQIAIPALNLNLTAIPAIPDQEHTGLFSYWEGAARFTGRHAKGMGYVEMTGY